VGGGWLVWMLQPVFCILLVAKAEISIDLA